ncbi:MAG: carboxymuconolactone decarboxylase family protein [Alphaproteobacteria bacterium]
MSIDALKNLLPEYAKDLKLNLSSLATDETLGPQQRAGTFLVSALASRNRRVIAEIYDVFSADLSPEAESAAKAAAAIMGMNNVYYRFLHLISGDDYRRLPARLRMNVMANPGVEKADFELWSLAVSAINGCGSCIDSHEAVLRKAGMTPQQIQTAVRIASVVHAVSAVLDGEDALGGASGARAA